ncbi:lipid-transfer protein [Chloroflexota bacterium]
MKEVAILGVGMHPWGKFQDKTWEDLAADAVQKALEDAGLEWTDIQFVSAGLDRWAGLNALMAGSTLSFRLGSIGIPATTCANACATGGYALKTAQAYIDAGFCDIALCFGGSVSPSGFFRPTQIREFDPTDMDTQRFRVLGQTNPTDFAFKAMRRMHLYGMTEDDLAQVKVKNSEHAQANPYARYRKVFTKEEVLNSPLVCYPLRLYEIAATSDGGAAVVLCSLEKAKKYTNNPVVLAGVGVATPDFHDPGASRGGFTCNAGDAAGMERRTPKAAYEEAGIGPEDLSLAEVYDLSSALELAWYEHIGLCRDGEAEGLLREGATAVGGRIPVNTSGGCSSSGEAIPAQALFQVCELVWQLRGDAGGRQVEGAKVGLAVNQGLQGNSSCIIVKR